MKREKTRAYREIARRVFATKKGIQLFNKINGGSSSMESQYISLVKTDMQL